MKNRKKDSAGVLQQFWHFTLHLRWHYQLFILSGGFLLGGLLSNDLNSNSFVIQFLNVHLLLFGGATAYNSYWDKDEGPIGGLKNPPKMARWMWMASLMLQMIGLLLALPMGGLYVGIYSGSLGLFWLYSTPLARWKGRPVKSLVAIGLSTGFNAVLLGYLAAGNYSVSFLELTAALGVSFILLSLYPISQLYQREEDNRRGDQTFAIQYGKVGVRIFFVAGYSMGLLLTATVLMIIHFYIGIIFGIIGSAIGFWIRGKLNGLTTDKQDYHKVMRIKYGTSMAFVLFLLFVFLLKHTTIPQIVSVAEILMK